MQECKTIAALVFSAGTFYQHVWTKRGSWILHKYIAILASYSHSTRDNHDNLSSLRCQADPAELTECWSWWWDQLRLTSDLGSAKQGSSWRVSRYWMILVEPAHGAASNHFHLASNSPASRLQSMLWGGRYATNVAWKRLETTLCQSFLQVMRDVWPCMLKTHGNANVVACIQVSIGRVSKRI